MPAISMIDRPRKNIDDWKDIREKDAKTLVLNKLKEKEMEYTKAHKPFSYPAAKMEIEDTFELIEKEAQRSKVDAAELFKKTEFDFDKFGSSKRFKLLSMKESPEDKLIDGMRTSVITNWIYDYQDIERPSIKVSVFVPTAMHEQLQAKSKKGTE